MRALDQLDAKPPSGGSPRSGGRSKGRPRVAWRTGYEGDEFALGVAISFALHALPVTLIVLALKGLLPAGPDTTLPEIAHPVIAATLLKLGKPIDPKKLPDRIVPQAATVVKQELNASQENPDKKPDKPDAGPPPPLAQESDVQKLIKRTDPFAEDAGKVRPEEGHENGVKEGTETDPNKVAAGDQYAAQLGAFIHDHWAIPTVISGGEANKLCAKFQIAIGNNMQIFYMKEDAVKSSGNEIFDDSARTALQTLRDNHTPLPEPPPEVASTYKGHQLVIQMTGASSMGDSKCK